MPKSTFHALLKKEIARIESSGTAKRHERVIERFVSHPEHAPRALITAKECALYNSNDYLGLRFHGAISYAEHQATHLYGTGPGGVRFICGTMEIHKQLEQELALFHGREDAMLFSSAFAANLAVIHCLIKGQSKGSLVTPDAIVISDELNHRSIIDGIRVAGVPSERKFVFRHRDMEDLRRVLDEQKGKARRAIIVTDGIFSMLGSYQDLARLQAIADESNDYFEEGVLTIVDDSHGVASFGAHGRGCEEYCGARCDLLVATLGKGFGVDGGYVAGDKAVIDYLRESAATYIYSNPIAPATAAAALQSLRIVNSPEGTALLERLDRNVGYFKEKMTLMGFTFAADSVHAIQPVLIGDPIKTREIVSRLFEKGILVTNISYPVVPKGRDEIRVQISAAHTLKDLDEFCEKFSACARE